MKNGSSNKPPNLFVVETNSGTQSGNQGEIRKNRNNACRKKLGGVLINSQHNFAWLTAGANNGIDASRETGAASPLNRSDGKKFMLANRIEMPRFLAEEISAEDFEPIKYAWADEKRERVSFAGRFEFVNQMQNTNMGEKIFQ